jgi:hypothetical protein
VNDAVHQRLMTTGVIELAEVNLPGPLRELRQHPPRLEERRVDLVYVREVEADARVGQPGEDTPELLRRPARSLASVGVLDEHLVDEGAPHGRIPDRLRVHDDARHIFRDGSEQLGHDRLFVLREFARCKHAHAAGVPRQRERRQHSDESRKLAHPQGRHPADAVNELVAEGHRSERPAWIGAFEALSLQSGVDLMHGAPLIALGGAIDEQSPIEVRSARPLPTCQRAEGDDGGVARAVTFEQRGQGHSLRMRILARGANCPP